MKGKMTVIQPNHTRTVTEFTRPIKLNEMADALNGGFLETVPLFTKFEGEKCVAFTDEEGKIKQLAVNLEACELWYNQLPRPLVVTDVLVGPLVIITGDDEFHAAL